MSGTLRECFFVTTRSKTNCTRSGRPRSRLSRMISSKNSRPRRGRSKICVRLTSICQIDEIPFVAYPPVFRPRNGSGMRFSHFRNSRSICSGPNESQICWKAFRARRRKGNRSSSAS